MCDDPRIMPIGRLIRRTSIDELPQLFSVLKNDMSLIGPRPVVEHEAALYGPQREFLLSAKPGISGYWQVYGRGDSTYESGDRQRMELF